MKKFTLAVLTLLVFAVAAFAQTSGRIVGTVAGPDGNIPGASITVKDTQTGKEYSATASEDGTFSFSQIEAGTYTVTVTAPGFKTFSATQVKVDANRDYPLDVKLEVGAITETVEVVAGAEVINATTGELNNTISPRQVKELPINGRNPLALLNLVAGSNPTSGSINGQRTSSVNYTRDGLNVQDNFIRNGFVQDQPTVDDTGEFTVITQNAGAEHGTGSTQVILVTPRGGSEFHGNLFEFNRNSKFAANNFFSNWNGTPRAFLNRNQFGGTLSGPAIFPRFGEGGASTYRPGTTFFFFNYEGFRLANQVPANTTTLLPAARTGNFTYIDNTGVTRTVNVLSGTGLNLGTAANLTTFNNAGGSIGVDPAVQARFLNLLPTAGTGAFTGINFLQALAFQRGNPETRNAVTARVDHDFNDKHSANFVYKRGNITDARTDLASGFATTTFVDQGGPTNLYVGAWRMQLTSSFSNELRGGYQRSEPFFLAVNDPRNLPFLIAPPLVTNPEPSFQSQGRNTDYWNLQDNATWTRGNHAFRFGGMAQLYRIEALNFAGVTPTYTFGATNNTATPGFNANLFPGGINATDLGRANSLRYFLGGIVGGGSQTANAISSTSGFVAGAPAIRRLNFDNYSFYVSDQWRVTDKLTLNLGLRYELYTPLNNPDKVYLEPIHAGGDPIATLTNPNGAFQVVGGNAGKPGDFFKADKDNFGPNISVAYTPDFGDGFLSNIFPGQGRTVFRGGYRVNYVNDEYVRAPDNANLNNVGLGATTAFARLGGTLAGSTQFRAIGLNNAPVIAPIVTPVSAFGPGGSGTRTYLQANQQVGGAGTLGGTISLIDPNLQVQRNYEYNFGIQREIGFQSVLEVRYVGGYSKELVRSIDYGQLRVLDSGLLADFLIARENCRLQGLTIPGAGDPTQRCTDARFNPGIVGSRPTPYISSLEGAGFLNNNVILGPIRAGTPGALAETYVINLIGITPGQGYNQLLVANPNGGVLNLTTNGGRYNYNSLQVELRRRFSGGLNFTGNYTFQKILTDVTGTQSESNQTRVEPYLDNNNPSRDYARPAYDRTHTFNFNGLYELPFGNGKRWLNQGGWVDRVFGGFQLSSIVNISSGVPTSIIDTRGTLNRAGRSGLQPATSSLTEAEIKKLFGVFKTPNGVFVINPAVLFATATHPTLPALTGVNLTQPLPAGYTITSIRGANPVGTAPFAGQVFFPNAPGSTGNLSRNFLNGPIYFNWDAGLAKNFRITENTRLQIRGEVFNVLNRANFFTADLDIGSTSFGRLTASGNAYAPRIVQFGARFEF